MGYVIYKDIVNEWTRSQIEKQMDYAFDAMKHKRWDAELQMRNRRRWKSKLAEK